MGDYTAMEVIVHDCPQDQVATVISILAEADLTLGFDSLNVYELTLGEAYGVHETAGDTSERIIAQVQERAPGVSIEAWTSPKYEWLGVYAAYTPELGVFQAECDDSGEPQFDFHWVNTKLKEAPATMTVEVFAATVLPKATGQPWRNRFLELGRLNEAKRLRPTDG